MVIGLFSRLSYLEVGEALEALMGLVEGDGVVLQVSYLEVGEALEALMVLVGLYLTLRLVRPLKLSWFW